MVFLLGSIKRKYGVFNLESFCCYISELKRVLRLHNFFSSLHTRIHKCMQKMSIYQWNAYLINISTPVSAMHLLIPFHDFFSLNTCLASNGSRGSVGAGGAGSGSASAIISLTSVSDPAFAVSSPSADDSLHPIIIFLSI